MKSLIKKLSYLGILLVVFGFSQTAHAAECEMISREFKNHSLKPKVSLVVGQTVTLAITTKNCIGKRINIQIIEGRGTYNEETEVNVLNSIIDNNIVTTTYEVGDHDCSSLTFGSDCIYDTQITIFDPVDNKALVFYGFASELFDMDTQLFFHCHIESTVNERKCTKNWVFKSATGIKKADGSEIGLVIPGVVYDVNSPCYDSTIGKYTEGCYEMLAPIPGIGSKYTDGAGVERDTGFTEKDGRQTVNTKKMQIGDYLNQIFRVALGILALIAVIMIIIAGVEYMVVESIYGKSAAKERIINAVTGLLIGLGIFLILSTINPKLLEVNFAPPDVSISFVDDPADVDAKIEINSTGVSNATATNVCTNRKSRGYYETDDQKYQAISYATANTTFGSLTSTGLDLNLTNGSPKGTTVKDAVEKTFAVKLVSLDAKLKQKGITPRFTEVFGPSTLAHGSPCHYFGTCVDLATGTSSSNAVYSTDVIEKIIRTADEVGLTAQFEFSKSQSIDSYNTMRDELASRGIDRCMVLYVKHATGWHFSVYDKQDMNIKLK